MSLPLVQIIPWVGWRIPFFSCHHHLLLLFKIIRPDISHFSSFSSNIGRLWTLISHNRIFNFLLFLHQFVVRPDLVCQFGIVRRLEAWVVKKQVFLRFKFGLHLSLQAVLVVRRIRSIQMGLIDRALFGLLVSSNKIVHCHVDYVAVNCVNEVVVFLHWKRIRCCHFFIF